MSSIKVSNLTKVPLYDINQVIYAISFNNDSETEHGAKQDEWNKNFAKIHKVKVKSIYIDTKGISYLLEDNSTGAEYGNEVPESQVSDDIEDLFKYLTKRWYL